MSNLQQTLQQHIQKHNGNGIFLDTNVLLLHLFACYQPSKIGTAKRLSKYCAEDGDMLIQFVANFNRVFTTAHVLAETSNLARQMVDGKQLALLAGALYPLFCLTEDNSLLKLNTEQVVIDVELFKKLGLTDSSIVAVTQSKTLLLTDDLDLYLAVLAHEGDAINFTHMREAAGII